MAWPANWVSYPLIADRCKLQTCSHDDNSCLRITAALVVAASHQHHKLATVRTCLNAR